MPASAELLSRIAAAKTAVLAQTELLHREFGRAQSNWKSDGTRVTPVDIAISENITRALREAFPADEFFSEELSGPEADAPIAMRSRFAWILDPIDGTNNYATGIAYCAISVGLFENGRPAYGIVYDMSRRTLIHGGPGFGAFDGERAATVRTATPTPQSLVGFHSPVEKKYARDAQVIIENFKIRALGSSTLHLAYVANGMLDGTIDHNVKIWDIAAAAAIALGAGAQIQFLNGEQFPVRTFDLHMPRIHYIAGNEAFCTQTRKLMSL